jgi:hypothetical protein
MQVHVPGLRLRLFADHAPHRAHAQGARAGAAAPPRAARSLAASLLAAGCLLRTRRIENLTAQFDQPRARRADPAGPVRSTPGRSRSTALSPAAATRVGALLKPQDDNND